MSHPILTIVAGSNGCGKSTITASSRDKFQISPVLDPDAIAKSIQGTVAGDASNIEAGKRVLRAADDFLSEQQSFTVETTLSGGRWRNGPKLPGYIIMVVRRNNVSRDQHRTSEVPRDQRRPICGLNTRLAGMAILIIGLFGMTMKAKLRFQ